VAAEGTMTDDALTHRMAEERAVCRVLQIWAYSRDQGDWEALRHCFHADGTIAVSWYSGPAAGFIERSMTMGKNRRPEERNKHLLGNMRATVVGHRAILEADTVITVREFIDGYLFDFASHARFYHLMEKRSGEWRIWRANCIYEKDRLEPVIPGSVPASFYQQVDLTGAESGFAFMRFRQTKRGRTIPTGLPLAGSAEEAALRSEAKRWLEGS
jgi:hypothetical protein